MKKRIKCKHIAITFPELHTKDIIVECTKQCDEHLKQCVKCGKLITTVDIFPLLLNENCCNVCFDCCTSTNCTDDCRNCTKGDV